MKRETNAFLSEWDKAKSNYQRDEEIYALAKFIGDYNMKKGSIDERYLPYVFEVAAAIYDAGYRKVEPIHTELPEGMKRFYFTYGTNKHFPFYRGWSEVIAPDKETAIAIFRCYHPNPPGSDSWNYAFDYSEEEFKKTSMYTDPRPDEVCHEVIGPWYPKNGGK
jgi:hypothetical protein